MLNVCRSWKNKSTSHKSIYTQQHERGNERVCGRNILAAAFSCTFSLFFREKNFLVGKVDDETSWQPFILSSVYLPNHYARRICAWSNNKINNFFYLSHKISLSRYIPKLIVEILVCDSIQLTVVWLMWCVNLS